MRSIMLQYNDILSHHFRYVEPTMNENGTPSWRIEYDMILHRPTPNQVCRRVQAFKAEFESKTKFVISSINYNFKDRLTLYISTSQKDVTIVCKGQKKLSRPGIGFVQGREKTLAEEQASRKVEVDSSPIVEYPVSDESRPATPSGQPTVTPTAVPNTQATVSVPSSSGLSQRSSSVAPPIQRFTQQSRSYAIARLRDSRIYSMARLYCGYLHSEPISISVEGETRLSLRMRLISEGFNIDDLRQLYFDFHEQHGVSAQDVQADLDAYRTYCHTSRIIRLQTAKEQTKKWYGLKGGQIACRGGYKILADSTKLLPNLSYVSDSGEKISTLA